MNDIVAERGLEEVVRDLEKLIMEEAVFMVDLWEEEVLEALGF